MTESRLRSAYVVCPGRDWRPGCGTCAACGRQLTGRLKWFCRSPAWCWEAYMANHMWGYARKVAIKRASYIEVRAPDYWAWREYCARLGCELPVDSVNHIVPRNGQGYGLGCWHHQDGLEPLCRPHHLEVTRLQRLLLRSGLTPLPAGVPVLPSPQMPLLRPEAAGFKGFTWWEPQ